jgi:hypothetical protein
MYKSSIELQKPKAYSQTQLYQSPCCTMAGMNMNGLSSKGIPNNTTRHFCLIGIWKSVEVLLIELRSLKFVKGWKNNFECCGSGIGIKCFERSGF